MEIVSIAGENYYKIANNENMRPFFMSVVSDSDHWMFISSNGGLTAGRKNAEFALFPYYTDDKITEFADITGSKSIFQIQHDNQVMVWEPFSERFNDKYNISRNLYKNLFGNKIIFEEIHHDLELTFSYEWCSSDRFGFVKKSEITNHSQNDYSITALDGIQNIMPNGVTSDLQTTTSNLVDAYKRNEIQAESGVGIFGLSAIIVDKAEPSESLKTNIAWSLGIENPTYLLSSLQLPTFRKKQNIQSETDVKGEKGAYFVVADLLLPKDSSKSWKIIANVNQNQSQVIALCEAILHDKNIENQVIEDIELGEQNLISLNATADGLQFTADKRKDTRHFSNVLFNIMRGGIFDHNYEIEKNDFVTYLNQANKEVCGRNSVFINDLEAFFSHSYLNSLLSNQTDADLVRLCTEYLPLKFSRRHGDPSRPWNKFSINTRSEIDGSKILDYEGNWRDIFQNWEALAYAYPEFIDGMIFKFLNASTFDGYNPYRVTKSGFDWETIEPDNPWSYIGYWGDHQIIYLLKFLEFIEKQHPGKLNSYFDKECFVYAAVPYCIKSYEEILQNPKDTISFNHHLDTQINGLRKSVGADGALLQTENKVIYHVNFVEKILATVLAKMSNFIPEGGIWMNTQRPEWNDANNALVGNGVSMVTLYYLRRFFDFLQKTVNNSTVTEIKISTEMVTFYDAIRENLLQFEPLLADSIGDVERKNILDALGTAASKYREHVYQNGFNGQKTTISVAGLKSFIQVSLAFIDHSIQANQREDKLYHAYNLMSSTENEVSISHLSEMLEGQVAVISSGFLDGKQTLEILNGLRKSALYRADQNSYILYPNKELPKFLEKNRLPKAKVAQSDLLKKLLENSNFSIINQDIKGDYHFNGNFHNAGDLKVALDSLKTQENYQELVAKETTSVLAIFEEVFNHKAFTGRSGTFFSFEGLGSIYWHMVSKLHLAVQEVCIKAINQNEDSSVIKELVAHYEEIGSGIGVHKTPAVYGAFPTDPYSHTPQHRGAQQPGMTGQVKEDILVRIAELGVKINNGKVQFQPTILQKKEFILQEQEVIFVAVDGKQNPIVLPKESLAFSFCQVPIIYKIAAENQIELHYADGSNSVFQSLELDADTSKKIFQRTNEIVQVVVSINKEFLR
ncbi:hypothetical protein [Flavobacterium restrictum]|uniref:Cellobiose phosphorylase n=1 Tax=Flavobacterium restrictum TaxID=2594428 RepID=A0A553EAL9_9FLAO|nr:hypothetical protein [Flavobacterium restrictum]TRX42127.1 hypothetical protein FNW21_02330 [Flavobacterium restrictum]